MRQYEYPLFAAADLSQATLTSQTVDLTNMIGFSIQSVTTGNGIGTLAIQGSNDNVINETFSSGVTNWTTIVTAAVAAPGTIMMNVSDVYYRWTRLVYTRTSGSGSISSTMQAKGV